MFLAGVVVHGRTVNGSKDEINYRYGTFKSFNFVINGFPLKACGNDDITLFSYRAIISYF